MDQVPERKVFNDNIHGNITLHPLCVKIIDTPQFQRLRRIKQLGAVEFVYYGATHSRFEHCIGTCHLAEVWVKHLKETLPSGLTISPEDELCVMIAGLCHDLGHGPLSHMFDKFYMKQVKAGTEIPHEELSVNILKHLIQANHLQGEFENYRLNESHMKMISNMINPKKMFGQDYTENKQRMFLFEIVNNKDNGIDVDKFDYFARDCLHVNITNSFDYKRLIKFSRVLIDEYECSHICFRDKEEENLYKMFELRYDLHRQVYSHKVTHTIHIMLTDALIRADPHLHLIIPDIEQGRFQSVSTMTEDIAAFSRLTDMVIWQIASTSSVELEASRRIISDIWSRRFYPSFRTFPVTKEPSNVVDIKENLFSLTNRVLNENGQAPLDSADKKDILVYVIKLDFTKDNKDPIDDVYVYTKRQPNKIIKLKEYMKRRLPPRDFSQHIVTVIWRNYKHAEDQNKDKVDALRQGFRNWCDKFGYIPNE